MAMHKNYKKLDNIVWAKMSEICLIEATLLVNFSEKYALYLMLIKCSYVETSSVMCETHLIDSKFSSTQHDFQLM